MRVSRIRTAMWCWDLLWWSDRLLDGDDDPEPEAPVRLGHGLEERIEGRKVGFDVRFVRRPGASRNVRFEDRRQGLDGDVDLAHVVGLGEAQRGLVGRL